MKAVTIRELKQELSHLSNKEIQDLCLRLARFKKENKELLTYMLFESSNEEDYIVNVKQEMDLQFEAVNKKTNYLIRKGLRRILTGTKKYIRYSQKKETEVELLIYYCTKIKSFKPSIKHNKRQQNIYDKQVEIIQKKISLLHEDLQYDYEIELTSLIQSDHL